MGQLLDSFRLLIFGLLCEYVKVTFFSNMAFCRIALDDIANDARRFSIEDANHPEKIREKFQEKTAPIIIYEEGDMTKGKLFGKDILEDSKTYVWKCGKTLS